MKEIYVENLKFNKKPRSNIDKLFREQKVKDSSCRHLQKLRTVTHHYGVDESIDVIHCDICGAVMSDSMIEKREKLIYKFKKLKK